MNNTINHVSDKSVYVTFDPTGTQWPSTYGNVQQVLADIGPWARQSVGLPNASVGVRGIAAIATEEDITNATDNEKIVTPKMLQFRLQNPKASQTVWGYTRYATDAEAQNTGEDTVAITPRSLNIVFNNRGATESLRGSARLSTTPQATAGVDDTTAMTPLKVKQAISALVPVQSNATESNFGLVQLATVAQVQSGAIRDGFAISPYTFNRLTATENAIGVLKIATQYQTNTGQDDTTAVTPLKLNNMRGTNSQFGVVRLSTVVDPNQPNTALSSGANVLPSDRSSVVGNGGAIYQGNFDAVNKYATIGEMELNIPIGGMIMAAFYSDHGNMMVADGRGLRVPEFPVLFQRIGYTYGGGGDVFNLPDARGLVVRGWDAGRGIDGGRAFGSYQDDAMQPITGGFTIDDQVATCNFPPNGVFYSGSKGVNYDAKSDASRFGVQLMFDSSRQTRTASETRVKSIALAYLIRVF